MKEKFKIVLSILIAILVGVIVLPFSQKLLSQKPSFQISTTIASALFAGILTFALTQHLSLDPCIRRVLRKGGFDLLQRAKMIIYILLNYSDEDILLKTTVENWIKLLTAGVKFAKSDWFTTYLISVDDWPKFGRIAEEYNEALNRKTDISKVRCIIQYPTPSQICQSGLVKDSKSAEIEVKVYDFKKVQPILSPTEIEDYAMFDEKYVIVGHPKRKELKPKDKVKVKLIIGVSLISPYTFTKRKLLEEIHEFIC